jgi:hypothetical protein
MERSVLQVMLEGALPMTGGAFAVFLLHSSTEKEYQQIDSEDEHSQGLAVEEMSSKTEDGFTGEDSEFWSVGSKRATRSAHEALYHL